MTGDEKISKEIDPKELAIEFKIGDETKKGYLDLRGSTYYAIKDGEVRPMRLDDIADDVRAKLLAAYFSNKIDFKSSDGLDLSGILLSATEIGRPIELGNGGYALKVYEKNEKGRYELQPGKAIKNLPGDIYDVIENTIKQQQGRKLEGEAAGKTALQETALAKNQNGS